MNLLLLPKELQNLIGEFNVEHRPRMKIVMNELVVNYNTRIAALIRCVNCGNDIDEEYSGYIFWNKFTFCSGFCRYEIEEDIRKCYRRVIAKRNKRLKLQNV